MKAKACALVASILPAGDQRTNPLANEVIYRHIHIADS
jgi:hypothetical protein